MTRRIKHTPLSHRFAPSALALALALASGTSAAASWVYTLDADFDLGTLTGVNHNTPNNDQLQLNVAGTSFPILWIANAGEDTVSKIDTTQDGSIPGKEIARYRMWFNSGIYAHDAWGGPAPSRTATDTEGNGYVALRWFGGYPTVIKILNKGFIDRNGNGVMDTVIDTNADGTIQISEMMPLVDSNGNGKIDPAEIQDERIAWAVRVPYDGTSRYNAIARALCMGTDGHLWVGFYNTDEYWKISSVDGSTLAGPVKTGGYPNYGCLIDGNGTLWGASWDYGRLHRIDNTQSNTGPHTFSAISVPPVYGLALGKAADGSTNVYMGGSCKSFVKYNTVTGVSYPAAVNYCSYAVGTDNDGNVLISKRTGGVAKFTPDGTLIWDKGSQVGSSDSRGVIADANNDIWQVHRQTHNIAKYKGSNGDFLGVKGVGYEPYTYSDASGTAALSITTKTGTWSVVRDGGAAGTQWGKLAWNASVPTGASVTGEVRAADNAGDLSGLPWTTVANGVDFNLTGRYLEARVRLTANNAGDSPIVYDVTLSNLTQAKCDVDGDGDIDKLDLNLISKARGQTPTADDPRDANNDGKIDGVDVKACIPKCTRLNCAIN